MNKTLNIIPTPQSVTYTEGEILKIEKIHLACKETDVIKSALSIFKKEVPFELSDIDSADVIICDCAENAEILKSDDLKTFDNQYADIQGYVIKKEADKPVFVTAKTDIGCAYGLMTLLQIAGQSIKTLTIRDYPDFKTRGNKWEIWAESGIWSYDFGDGAQGYTDRIIRKLDMCLKFKINAVYADAFGLGLDRIPGYADIMRKINDEGRKRGVMLWTGCYGMGYGSSAFPNGGFSGNTYKNRKSYPDGEIYECIGTYEAWQMTSDTSVDRTIRLTEVRAREWGTCLSNEALLELKLDEMKKYLVATHCGGFYLHNMDAHEVHPEMWLARCDECRKRWPNDDIFAEDGFAGAIAYYFGKMANELSKVKDGDYDAARDFSLMVVSPGYSYHCVSSDEDYDTNIKFWSAVSRYIKSDNVIAGFREQFWYQEKSELRSSALKKFGMEKQSGIINFSGADGFYDDKLFTVTALFNTFMKDFDVIINANGNAFQEPLQIFNAEYLWNSENSGFYNVENMPDTYDEFIKLYNDSISSIYRPDEIYSKGGMIDVICKKHYGDEIGEKISEVFKLCGPGGEPPIACAASVDIYTRYNHIEYDFRWDNEELSEEKIEHYKSRFEICHDVTKKAKEIMDDVLSCDMSDPMRSDLEWFAECFEMGAKLTGLFVEYMNIYSPLNHAFRNNLPIGDEFLKAVAQLKSNVDDFTLWLKSLNRTPIDRLGGSMTRREYIAEHLDYWTKIMKSSIESGKRIPDDVRPLATKNWW